MHNIRVVASSGNGYATATDYVLVITTGTVGGASVVGYVVGSFSIEKRSAVMPTTAARTLDVSATGEAGLDWANIGSPTTAQNLSATNIDVDQVVASVSGAVGSVTGAVGSVAAGGITAASIATGAVDADALAADAVAEIADGVWDEDATGHQTQGSFGQVIGDSGLDTDTIWGLANANLDAAVSSRASSAALTTVQSDTDDIQTRLPAALIGGRMDSSVGAYAAGQAPLQPTVAGRTLDVAITGEAGIDLDNTVGTLGAAEIPNLDAAVSTRATPAQVNTEVLDVLNVDTFAEPPQEAPPATASLVKKIGYIYKAFRNRITQTSTQFTVYNDDAITVGHKATVSDDGTTFDRGEVATGP